MWFQHTDPAQSIFFKPSASKMHIPGDPTQLESLVGSKILIIRHSEWLLSCKTHTGGQNLFKIRNTKMIIQFFGFGSSSFRVYNQMQSQEKLGCRWFTKSFFELNIDINNWRMTRDYTCKTMGSCSGGFFLSEPFSSHTSKAVNCSVKNGLGCKNL